MKLASVLKQSASESSLLAGVSRTATLQNEHVKQKLGFVTEATGQGVSASSTGGWEAKSRPPKFDGGGSRKNICTSLDEKAFSQATERISAKISELRSSHDSFDPRASKRQFLKRDAEFHDDNAERLHERLEIYKMSRSVEGEFPPIGDLPPSCTLPPLPKSGRLIVMKNMGSETLTQFRPSVRSDLVHSWNERHTLREREMATFRKDQVTAEMEVFEQVLARKTSQADAALEKAKLPRGSNFRMQQLLNQKRWLRSLVAVAFLGRAARMLKEQKLNAEHIASVVSLFESVPVQDQSPETNVKPVKTFQARMSLLMSFAISKRKVLAARRSIRLVLASLQIWSPAGRLFIKLKKVGTSVRLIQAFWRECMVRLRRVVQQISDRWLVLERNDINRGILTGELEARSLKKTLRTTTSSALHPMEANLESYVVTEEIRMIFIRNELRARRFFVLPQLNMWKEECRQWRNSVTASLNATNMGTKELVSVLNAAFFWPPSRPSYLPPAHLKSEEAGEHGRHCPRGCRGKQGDEIIVAMVHAARENPLGGGWRDMPSCAVTGAYSVLSKTISANARRRLKEHQAAPNPFGEVGEEDLKLMGIIDTVPGGDPSLELSGCRAL